MVIRKWAHTNTNFLTCYDIPRHQKHIPTIQKVSSLTIYPASGSECHTDITSLLSVLVTTLVHISWTTSAFYTSRLYRMSLYSSMISIHHKSQYNSYLYQSHGNFSYSQIYRMICQRSVSPNYNICQYFYIGKGILVHSFINHPNNDIKWSYCLCDEQTACGMTITTLPI